MVNTALCSIVDQRLRDVTPCRAQFKDLDLGGCDYSASMRKCNFLEECVYAPEHSFSYDGGYVSTYVCIPHRETRVQAGVLALLGLLGAMGLLWVIVLRPYYQELRAFYGTDKALRHQNPPGRPANPAVVREATQNRRKEGRTLSKQ